MVVQHNISAMNANRYYGINNSGLSKSLEKLSSGFKINRAGDDAAGLAVSEKMRSQIAGISQAVKNAQDGISMIQTFEGALTETDSILQRMKTLANQSANGTYQNEVDREAIQLEFDQLNDELNQIADTDFNGVVALNGGEMADGLKANADNVFDYRSGGGAASTERTYADGVDFSGDAGDIGGILQNATYNKDEADTVWNKLGLTPESSDPANPDELQITFTYDGSKWQATGVLDKNGNKVDVKADKLADLKTTKTANGGFKIDGTDLNLVFDTTKLGKFDTATIKLQNIKADVYAPTNINIKEDTASVTGGNAATNAKLDEMASKVTITLDASITDATMDENTKLALDALKGATFQSAANTGVMAAASFKGTAPSFTDTTAATRTLAIDNTTGVISWTDAGGTKHNLATVTIDNTALTTGTTGTLEFGLETDAYAYTKADGLKANSIATPNANKPTADTFKTGRDPVSESDSYSNGYNNLTYTDHIVLQVGARSKDAVDFTFKYASAGIGELKANMDCSARTNGLGTADLDLTTAKAANYAIDKIDSAINKVSMVRATFGAVQNRLEHKIDNMNVTKENLTSAESRIRDTNMAEEMSNFTKNQILSQASQSMLAQANSLPQSVLQLLG